MPCSKSRGAAPRSHFWKIYRPSKTALGRTRERRFAARTVDLDLLLWGSEVMDTFRLCVPHPQISRRNFVLVPLCDLIPEYAHPVMGKSFAELLGRLR